MTDTSFATDFKIYVGRITEFNARDWLVYVSWIGMISGLFVATSAFLLAGHLNGVAYPSYVWNIPIGCLIFTLAIACDTIGHRTVYKEVLQKGEALVHHMTIFAGVASVVVLCLAYGSPDFYRIPALVLIFLSVVYSLIDEALHWHRYLTRDSDRVEMWSHFFILLGHMLMITTWWHWFAQGYPGVKETLLVMP